MKGKIDFYHRSEVEESGPWMVIDVITVFFVWLVRWLPVTTACVIHYQQDRGEFARYTVGHLDMLCACRLFDSNCICYMPVFLFVICMLCEIDARVK